MNGITQEMKYRQSLMRRAEKFGVGRAGRKYSRCRSFVCSWKTRCDAPCGPLPAVPGAPAKDWS